MRIKFLPSFFLIVSCFIGASFLHAQTRCCGVPDSLKVTNVTTTGYCLSWRVNDSARCDTAKGFQLQIKPAAASTWTTRTKVYPGGILTTYTICDSTSTKCTNYQWRVRNICIKNGDTTFTAYVNGPNFKTKCAGDSLTNGSTSSVTVYPNPAYNKVILKAVFGNASSAKVMIANMNGRVLFEKTVTILNSKLELPVDISQFDKNVYFITVSDGKTVVKTSFTKQ